MAAREKGGEQVRTAVGSDRKRLRRQVDRVSNFDGIGDPRGHSSVPPSRGAQTCDWRAPLQGGAVVPRLQPYSGRMMYSPTINDSHSTDRSTTRR